MTVPVRTWTDLEHGTPVSLFAIRSILIGTAIITNQHAFAVSKDSQRFLFSVFPLQDTTAPLTVLLNWLALRK